MTTIIENGDFPDGRAQNGVSATDDTLLLPGSAVIFGALTGTSVATFDADAFALDLSAGQLVEIYAEGDASAGEAIGFYELGLFDQTVSEVERPFTLTAGERLAASLRMTDTSGRIFFVINGLREELEAANPVDTGGFRLDVRVGDDHGATLAAATPLAPGTDGAGILIDEIDRDVFTRAVTAGERLEINLGGDGPPGQTPSDVTRLLTFLPDAGVEFSIVSQDTVAGQ
ncbi:MAG: hypothetical protein AAF568_07660, partial [Pseudomonadota bacterium]